MIVPCHYWRHCVIIDMKLVSMLVYHKFNNFYFYFLSYHAWPDDIVLPTLRSMQPTEKTIITPRKAKLPRAKTTRQGGGGQKQKERGGRQTDSHRERGRERGERDTERRITKAST
jgi:hypothetical protein